MRTSLDRQGLTATWAVTPHSTVSPLVRSCLAVDRLIAETNPTAFRSIGKMRPPQLQLPPCGRMTSLDGGHVTRLGALNDGKLSRDLLPSLPRSLVVPTGADYCPTSCHFGPESVPLGLPAARHLTRCRGWLELINLSDLPLWRLIIHRATQFRWFVFDLLVRNRHVDGYSAVLNENPHACVVVLNLCARSALETFSATKFASRSYSNKNSTLFSFNVWSLCG